MKKSSYTKLTVLALICGSVFLACATTSPSSANNMSLPPPPWVNSPYSIYNELQYIARTGFASTADEAEKAALANLTAYFGVSISDTQTINNVYIEAVRNGAAAQWSDTTSMQRTISTSSSLDALVGAEVHDTWYDGKGTYYALALMDRARTAVIYNDMIRSNRTTIDNLVNMPAAQKNTIEAFTRYQFAAAIADINVSYGNVLKVLGVAPAMELTKGDEYRLEALNIARAIPVRVVVQKAANVDTARRIENAFIKALNDFGFRTGSAGSPYSLNVNLNLSEVQLPNQQNKFVRYEISANFTDTRTGTGLNSYNINGREGHVNISEAENRAIAAAEKRINEDYSNSLTEAFLTLLPRRQ